MSSHHNTSKLREAGVNLIPYGLSEPPKVSEVTRLRKSIENGINLPSGEVLEAGEEMAAALSKGWIDPDAMISQFKSPRFKSTRAGTVATVSGLMASPYVQTNPFNPRANTKLEIPDADADGVVAMPWSPIDRKVDPDMDSRILIDIEDRDELNDRVLESERHILADQGPLRDLVTREGIEQDVLAIVVRYEAEGLENRLAITAIDGNSRVAIARAEFRDWIISNRDEILAVTRSAKPRKALARVLDQMRDGLFPLEYDDVVSLRHLHTAVERLVSDPSTEELLKGQLYAVPNLFVVPVTLVVAFEPSHEGATVLESSDQMMRNLHHPSRVSKAWDRAAGFSEIRDEIVTKLHDSGGLDIGETLFMGPRYAEAVDLHDAPEHPDDRSMRAIWLINGIWDTGREARLLLAGAVGTPGSRRAHRAQLITSILSEQLRTASNASRQQFVSTMHDILDTKLFGTSGYVPEPTDTPVEEMLDQAIEDQEAGKTLEQSPAIAELAFRGAVALATGGQLQRSFGQTSNERARPYQTLENMLADKSGLGLKVLAAAIIAWRENEELVEYDRDERVPLEGGSRMSSKTLEYLFPTDDSPLSPSETPSDVLRRMVKILDERFQPVVDDLLGMEEVIREGAPSDAIDEVLQIIEPARRKLELQSEKFKEFHRGSGEEAGGDLEDSDD